MASETDVANLALVALGRDEIVDINDGTNKNAVRCKVSLPPLIDEVLQAHTWHFAKYRAALANGPAPAFGWSYSYPLPQNPYCLRLLELVDVGEDPPQYELEGRAILCNYPPPLKVRCIVRVPIGQFDPAAATALGTRLSAHMAYATNNSTDVRDGQFKLYNTQIVNARSLNAQQAPPRDLDGGTSELLRARGG